MGRIKNREVDFIMQQKLLSFWEQKKYHGLITRWLYELGSERRLGEIPQLADYTNKYIYPNQPVKQQQRIFDFGICHNSFKATLQFNDNGKHISDIKGASRCNERFCPMCETIRARQEYVRLSWKMEQLKNEFDFFFLTLTIKNTHNNFWEHLKVMNYASDKFYDYFGCRRKNGWAKGFYGSWEVTYSNDKGFHPHLHIVIAVPKDSYHSLLTTKNGQIKSITYKEKELKNGIDFRVTSQYDLVNKYREFLIEGCEKLNITLECQDEILKYPHLDFRKCYNIENDVRELTKYFIDFSQINDKEAFIIYCQSIFGVKRKKKTGVFKWTRENENDWKNYIDDYHQSIVQNKNSISCIFQFVKGSHNNELSLLVDEILDDYTDLLTKKGQFYIWKYKDLKNLDVKNE